MVIFFLEFFKSSALADDFNNQFSLTSKQSFDLIELVLKFMRVVNFYQALIFILFYIYNFYFTYIRHIIFFLYLLLKLKRVKGKLWIVFGKIYQDLGSFLNFKEDNVNFPVGQVANVGPAQYNYDESISTLRYANRAKNICNKAKINEDPKDALLRKLQEEIRALKGELEDGKLSLLHDNLSLCYLS